MREEHIYVTLITTNDVEGWLLVSRHQILHNTTIYFKKEVCNMKYLHWHGGGGLICR